jgi:hypothetical protein
MSGATKVYVEALSHEKYSNMTKNSGRKGIPCLLYIHTDDGTVVLPVPSRASALETGLLCPRFATTKRSRVLERLPATLYPIDAGGQVGTDNSASTVVQPTFARPEPRKPLYHFSQSPVVFVDPIDRPTFEQESGLKCGPDFSASTKFFFRISPSMRDPSGIDIPDYSRRQCVPGWDDVRSYLRDTHMKASTTKVTKRTQFKLLPKEDQEKDRTKRSRRSNWAETRQTYDSNAGEGASGSTVRS